MPEFLQAWQGTLKDLAWWHVVGVAVAAAFLLQFVVGRILLALTGRTATNVDDRVVGALRWPLFITVLLAGVWLAAHTGDPERTAPPWVMSLLWTIGIVFWMRGLLKAADALLDALARKVDDFKWIEPRSLPLYEILAKLVVVGAAIYALLIAWDIDVTAWLASAGILGIAFGFAAKDTLANLFAGMFILADAPYKIGDFIVLGSGERGKVTDIGIRSTRILTRDDIEVTIPNAAIANGKIVNETSGPSQLRRVRVNVGIAYDADLDRVCDVLLDVAKSCDLLTLERPPSVRVRGFGDSAIDIQIRGYIPEPVLRGRAVDRLCRDIHRRLGEEDIEIPFPQRVVHMEGAAAAN